MRARYLGANADLMKVRGSKHDTGEVLQMALGIGARSAGHWQGAHATPIDANFPDVEVSNNANRYSYMFGITVNTLGTRFFDEGEAEHSYTYAKTGWAVLGQPGGVAYQIFDQKGLPFLIANRYVHAQPTEAATIGELATKLGLEPTVLQHTVEEFNNAVQESIPLDATKPDGRCTVGIHPKKANWAMKIDKPPFRAYPVTCGITFTFGGVQIDTIGQVLNTGGKPIHGLYASGDIMGLFFHNYPSCSGQTRNLRFRHDRGKKRCRRNARASGSSPPSSEVTCLTKQNAVRISIALGGDILLSRPLMIYREPVLASARIVTRGGCPFCQSGNFRASLWRRNPGGRTPAPIW